MKRKIAMLMSAMMVFSAMPMTANAAQLKSDTVLNTTFGKANETIDPNAGSYGSGTALELNNLKGRRSVLKINLNDDGTNAIPAGTSFNVKLSNGTFGDFKAGTTTEGSTDEDKAFTKQFGYVNEYTTYSNVAQSTSLKDTYTIIAKNIAANSSQVRSNETETLADADNKIKSGEVYAFSGVSGSSDLENAIKALNSKIATLETDVTGGTITNEETLLNALASEVHAVVVAYIKQETAGSTNIDKYPSLAHIPYKIELVSPTEARVTLLYGLSDSDKKITLPNSKTADESKFSIKLYKGQNREPIGNIVAASPYNEVEEEAQETETLSAGTGTKLTEITHFEIKEESGAFTNKETTIENPYIALPLGAVKANGDGPVKATVVADYNDKIVGGEYTITKGLETGSTSLTYDANNVKSFDDLITVNSLTLKENVRNTIGRDSTGNNGMKDEAKIVLRLGSGFTFKNPGAIRVTDASGRNKNLKAKVDYVGANTNSENKSAIEVNITGLTDRTNPIGIDFSNIEIEPVNENRYGDVEVTVSGDNVDTQTVKIAQRERLGFKLTTLKDPKEIISGRHYDENKNTMTEQDNTTVEVKFSEVVPNTLVNQRALDFTLPDGVKFVDAEIKDYRGFEVTPKDSSFEIRDNGKTLRLKRVTDNNIHYKVDGNNRAAEFTMKLNLSVDPGFSGDIKLAVTGGGQSDVTETVIAKAVLPFEIKTQTTKLNMGYQDYDTADIVITETRPGMFLEGKTAVLSLSAPYGTQELGFSQAQFEVSGGELEVKEKDFKVGSAGYSDVNNDTIFDGRAAISFKVNKASYKNPSTITIKNVKVGTTRSVPFGAYDLKLHGDAVINNYANKIDEEKVVQLPDTMTSKGEFDNDLVLQNNTSSYDFKAYVDVVTETGTFDKTVKVSVGDKTVLVGDQAIDMDVAPYIQATSNSTMVPLRFVSVALGVDSGSVANPDASNKVAWDANTKTTTIYYGAGTGQKIIQFQAGSNIMTVDGTRIPMEYGVKAEIKDGRMFVPFRALGQALGVNVAWDADTRTAIYNGEHARNASVTTTAATTASTTTESTTESTTASDSTTESTTAKQ